MTDVRKIAKKVYDKLEHDYNHGEGRIYAYVERGTDFDNVVIDGPIDLLEIVNLIVEEAKK